MALNKFCQLGEMCFCKCSVYPPALKGCSSEKQAVLPALHMSALVRELANAVRRFLLLFFYIYFMLFKYIYKSVLLQMVLNLFSFLYLPGQHKQFLLVLFSFTLQLCFEYLQHTCKTVHLSSVIFTQGKKDSLPSAAFLSSGCFLWWCLDNSRALSCFSCLWGVSWSNFPFILHNTALSL